MKKIKDFILKNSYFQLDDYDTDYLQFTTREHGIRGDYDSAGKQDMEEARKLCKLINFNFPEVIATWNTCDEWTNIHVNLRKR
jgi:hypothetical protein